eukprot:scaffold629875_cov47-Prasinocladus_malaysianus.AAC.1
MPDADVALSLQAQQMIGPSVEGKLLEDVSVIAGKTVSVATTEGSIDVEKGPLLDSLPEAEEEISALPARVPRSDAPPEVPVANNLAARMFRSASRKESWQNRMVGRAATITLSHEGQKLFTLRHPNL